jgi:hypothetical protein
LVLDKVFHRGIDVIIPTLDPVINAARYCASPATAGWASDSKWTKTNVKPVESILLSGKGRCPGLAGHLRPS